MHTLNSTGHCVLASLTAALSFNSTLTNEIGRRVALVIRGLKLFDAPVDGNKDKSGYRAANKTTKRRDGPALFFVEFVAHDLGELFELALGLCIISVNDEGLEVPEAPAQVLETLALLEIAGHFGADL